METSIGNVKLQGCIMNASGILCTSEEELRKLEKSDSAAIVSKSCTFEERTGNDRPRLQVTDFGSFNSMGLPNNGFEFYQLLEFSKPYILSVSAINSDETISMLQNLEYSTRANLVELNISCPNVKNPFFGDSSINIDTRLLRKIFEQWSDLKIGLKLPPYFYESQFDEVSEIIERYPIKFITCINSIPNTLIVDSDRESCIIKPNNGLGGLGGKFLKPIGLSNVYNFRKRLPDIDIIGCGGITTGRDVFEYLLCGASAVQVGTTFLIEGVDCFDRLNKEFKAITKDKGYESILEFKGKLKQLD